MKLTGNFSVFLYLLYRDNVCFFPFCRRFPICYAGADPEILKREGAPYRPPWLADEENFSFQTVLKSQSNIRNYKFLAKYFYQYFQFFSIFIYNESLPIKSYKLFKICKRFDKEREKTLMQQSVRKEVLGKIALCFKVVL